MTERSPAGAERSPAWVELLPGLALLAAVAGAAWLVGTTVPLLSPLVLAIATGAALANAVGTPERAEAGIRTHSLLLETGIVLLGASISAGALLSAGPTLVVVIACVVVFGVLLVEALGYLSGLDGRTGSLLAAGSSICGVSAIAAVAPSTDATDSQIAYAAGTILLFDALTIVAFPPIGHLLGMGDRAFGIWVGLAMFSTGPVAAAGFAHSQVAGEWATITKLARNSLIGLVAVAYSIRYVPADAGARRRPSLRRIWGEVPKFLVGFLALATATSTGLLSTEVTDFLATASDALFMLAFVGLGFDIRLSQMRTAGAVPVAVVGTYLLVASALTFLLVRFAF